MKPLPEDEIPKKKRNLTEGVAGALSVVLIIALCIYGLLRCNEDMQNYNDVIIKEWKLE